MGCNLKSFKRVEFFVSLSVCFIHFEFRIASFQREAQPVVLSTSLLPSRVETHQRLGVAFLSCDHYLELISVYFAE